MRLDSPNRTSPVPVNNELHWNPIALLGALLAGFAVHMFRMDHHRWVPAIWIEFAAFSLASVAMFYVVRRWIGRRKTPVPQQTVAYLAQAGAAVSVLALIAWHLISRNIGLGDANETVALLAVQCISWHIAVFASVKGFEKTSLVLCGAIVFFVCCMTSRFDILLLGSIFAAAALWWLAGIYWSTLDSKAIDGNPKTIQIHGASTAIGVIAIAIGLGIAMLVPLSTNRISIRGFMPFSGGEEGYQDEFATSGVGDGNMLMAGNNATTTGAVDSNEFIEDDKPSMYDVMTEKYDGPARKKKFNRAVALDEVAKHIHDVVQSEQSGRTFRTMRNTDKTSDIKLKDKLTKALFFVEGSVPARFVIESFQHFDGLDWTRLPLEKTGPTPPKLVLQTRMEKPVFKMCLFRSGYLTSSRSHRVKIMRLQTPNLPSPAFLDRWHIDRVNDPQIFQCNDAGHVQFAGEVIPEQTVIDVQGYVPNYHTMRSANDLRNCRPTSWGKKMLGKLAGETEEDPDPAWQQTMPKLFDKENSPFLQIPDNGSRQEIESLAKAYTEGIRPGWNQIEAIVNRIREDFELDPESSDGGSSDVVILEAPEDTVGQFLDQKGGPSWMFASSCVMALRSAGYPTRLASGFLVKEEDYNRKARQSIVTSDNMHMWPEVCLDGKYWIPLEPTPGFPVPYSTETMWQWLTSKAYAAYYWICDHPLTCFLVATGLVLTYLYRVNFITFLMLIWWHLSRCFWPQNLLRATRQLIDLRFWAAGDSRPLSKTIMSWYSRVDPGLSTGFYDLWNGQNYGDQQNIGRADLAAHCRQQIEQLTLKKIKTFVIEKSKREAP
ncbi:transglutaminase-like domain-containing protein [Mariniblastus fucicola]|uniref:Transglutaminase-like superfamily protein n=1 Tax=Mariniblastus fucicola TaxID=980251 RepID=A0A5B9PFJ2_9BACT|nr:transglutaminase family protein [Mariniblastus fucicola]QEG23950.1 Transglutaminase-like superfamily protein [Mariniblastus fucicola]